MAAGGFFGELCLFSEICKYRHDTATAKEVKSGDGVSCFMLTSEAVAGASKVPYLQQNDCKRALERGLLPANEPC